MSQRYATIADMTARYGEYEVMSCTDRDNTGAINESVANTALDDASAEIDGYLSRYQRPFAVIPRDLVRVACDIAHYRLLGINNTQLTDEIQRRYRDNVAWLDKVASGKVALDVPASDAVEMPLDDTDAAVQFTTPPNKVFGRDR